MSYEEAEAYLYGLGIDAMKSATPSLHRIEALCEVLDHPERSVPALHVTGTNGKTSTARLASSILTATGLSVGTYTSPHLESIDERIVRDGQSIGKEALGEVFDHLIPYVRMVESNLNEELTFFEVLTAMFFLWAAEASVDAIVVEVGLGGRWDATNVVPAPVAVITNIAIDHAALLGEEKLSIAKEKSGIVKAKATLVSAERDPRVIEVIEDQISWLRATSSFIDREWDLLENKVAVGGRYLSVKSSATAYEGLFVPLHGPHQGVNAATAVEAVTRFLPVQPLDEEVILEGLGNAVVPGRIEALRYPGRATVVLDVAHNPDGISALVSSLAEAFAFEKVHFVFGVLSDKDFAGMLTELRRLPCWVYATAPRGVRAVPVDELCAAATQLGLEVVEVEDAFAAAQRAIATASVDELVCVTGSHYVVGEVRRRLLDSVI
ncbi:MAG: bifunctional folylpolyglutamate synthase/dihydrofolate synthase [Actinomycetota bacterium]|nr:bifunctional folylpolyglutamate synthase/dihydrofolate synthase [Actinomycetota bacterium]